MNTKFTGCVTAGCHHATLPATHEWSAADPVLDGRPAFLPRAEEARLPVPVDGKLELVARWPPRTVLRVVDQVTGADLAQVDVIRCTSGGWNSPVQHPCECSGRCEVGPC